MHNNIMAPGSRDRPPMLATREYAQWRSRFLRYIDTRPNGDALRKCLLEGPYTPSTVIIPAVPATKNSPTVPERTTVETILNMKLLKGYNKVNPSTFKMSRLNYFGSLENSPLTIERQWSHTTQGKEIAKPITPPSESASEEDSYPEQAQKDKDMQKNLALIAKYFKKLYKPTNNNLRTSSNPRNNNVETTPRETVGSQVVSQTGIQCFNCKEFGHFSKEYKKPKRVKDSTYHKEKMLMCKQAEKGVQLQAKQTDWLADMNKEIDEQELEAHYSYMKKIHEVPTEDLGTDSEPLEQIQKQLKKVNTTLAHEMIECKSILEKTSRTLGESNSIRDSCLVALQNKQTEFERYKTLNDRTVDYEKLEHKLNETLGLLAQKDIDIKEGLKLKAHEIFVVKERHDELVKQSLLTKSHYKGLVKEKTHVITDLKLKEEKDIDKMISMEKQLKFLNEIIYKKNQSIQTNHMLAPNGLTFNGRPTFANPMYLKRAQSEKPCLYEIPNDQSDPIKRRVPDREVTLTLKRESQSKLNKDLVRPYDYTKLNSLYEIFKPPTQEYQIQVAHANEIRKKMWRQSFVKTKPNIFKNINFLPVSKSISKSRQAYNVMTNNINHLRELVDQAWVKHSKDHYRAPTAHDMEILIKICLMPLALNVTIRYFRSFPDSIIVIIYF
nr:hypothetical protein [Tanacetum cinerariifolium]